MTSSSDIPRPTYSRAILTTSRRLAWIIRARASLSPWAIASASERSSAAESNDASRISRK